jgi:hypothetical protein
VICGGKAHLEPPLTTKNARDFTVPFVILLWKRGKGDFSEDSQIPPSPLC